MTLDIAALALFAAMVTASLRVSAYSGSPAARTERVHALIAVALVGSFTAGVFQRELWPFSSWPLVAGTLGDTVTQGRLVGVDGDGREHDIDARAWQPLAFDELMSWMQTEFPKLEPTSKQRAAAYLLDTVEAARLRTREGNAVGSSRRILGPLAAPSFILHPLSWNDPFAVPDQPFVLLRWYQESWSLNARAAGSASVERRLLFESSGF